MLPMQKERALTDIPDGEVDEVVNDFQSEGAKTTKELQPNGNWTVRAIFLIRKIFRKILLIRLAVRKIISALAHSKLATKNFLILF